MRIFPGVPQGSHHRIAQHHQNIRNHPEYQLAVSAGNSASRYPADSVLILSDSVNPVPARFFGGFQSASGSSYETESRVTGSP